MPIDFYNHAISPPARACIITAKLLNVELNVKDMDIFGGATRTPEYLKINPSHTVPTLVDNGFTLFESRAIMTYLVNKYAPTSALYPKDAQARAQVDKILFYDASEYYPSLKNCFFPVFRHQQKPPQSALDELKEKIEILENILRDQQFMAGVSVTLADISLVVSVPILKMLFPQLYTAKLQAWYERVEKAVPIVKELHSKLQMKSPFEKKII